MEEFVGKFWNDIITRIARDRYPAAAVPLAEVEKTTGILFRAFGGDPGLRIAAATAEEHGARRRFLQRVAGSGEKILQARIDRETLRLPPEIACFPERALNRDLYLWLATLAACADHDVSSPLPWYRRNQRATQAALTRFPGSRARYERLCAAHMAQRPRPEELPEEEAAQEFALRQALLDPGSVNIFPILTSPELRPPHPIPLWLADTPAADLRQRRRNVQEDGASEGGGTPKKNAQAHRAERVEEPEDEAPFLLMFRAESLLSWGEYIKINRAFDEEEDENAESAAADMDHLSLTQNARTAASRVKFDLDLPSAAEDDSPVGEGILLPEWDYRKKILLEKHCRIQPLIAREAAAEKLPLHLRKTAIRLRQQFAALAPARRWLKGQQDGSEIDLDACVRHFTDRAHGRTPDNGAYLAQVRHERDLACLLLADLSLSTDAWISDTHRIVDVIRESLLLFSEALSATGDPFGLYGFSSLKRQNVRFHILKDFRQPYNDIARGRILALRPGYYTRMGGALRQAISILDEYPAARKLLLLISDGKPNDLDLYDSRYGIEDTRMAIHEARRAGLYPFCVTIDREAGAYLPYIFGPAGFTVIRKPEELPHELPLLYAQLTRE
ncbi:MAG: nitric oxide reductase [Betaproteobacteria bacterium]|nr:nitric oxide reductase [Betaproteobacteria bacterium]